MILSPLSEVGHLTLHHPVNICFTYDPEVISCGTKYDRCCAARQDGYHVACE
jgi:hypothetical protein